MATAALTRYTPEEYLALERHAEFRSEYLNGRIIAMTGGSIPHNYIGGNVYAGLLARFSGRPCHVFFADVKVRFGRGTNYTYPDVMALCGAPGYGDEHGEILTNPALIVEVLSRSTEAYDRGDKFKGYKAIDTLREYLLISQDQVSVEHFVREGDFWPSTLLTDLDAAVECVRWDARCRSARSTGGPASYRKTWSRRRPDIRWVLPISLKRLYQSRSRRMGGFRRDAEQPVAPTWRISSEGRGHVAVRGLIPWFGDPAQSRTSAGVCKPLS